MSDALVSPSRSWHPADYLGVPAFAYGGGGDGGALIAVVPGRGGKIVSLVGPSGREWLVQPRPERWARPGPRFVDAEMCGWDECAPTVDPCELDSGDLLSDHGDLWDVPWEYALRGRSLTTVVRGRDFDYTFERTILPAEGGFDLLYRADRDGPARPFGWTAHPQFLAPAGTRVELDVDEVIDVAAPDTPVQWRPALAEPPEGGWRKVWTLPDRAVISASLVHPDGDRLVLTWSGDVAPYLGVWCEDHVYSHERVVALEPSTAWHDATSAAAKLGTVPFIGTGLPPLMWALTVRWG